MTPNAGFFMLGHCHVLKVHYFLFSSLWYKSKKLNKQDSMKNCKCLTPGVDIFVLLHV